MANKGRRKNDPESGGVERKRLKPDPEETPTERRQREAFNRLQYALEDKDIRNEEKDKNR